MRAGRLNTFVYLHDTAGNQLRAILIGIQDDTQQTPTEPGILGRPVTIRTRWTGDYAHGYTLRNPETSELWYITAASNPDRKQQDALISARVVEGSVTTINDDGQGGGTSAHIVMHGYIPENEGDHGYLSDSTPRRQAEFLNSEYQAAVGDTFSAEGGNWEIDQLDPNRSTGTTTRCWVSYISAA